MEDKEPLLARQPEELGLSPDFCKKCREMGFRTLSDILALPANELRERKGFNYLWLEELISLLDKHNILHLLQPIPGSIPG